MEFTSFRGKGSWYIFMSKGQVRKLVEIFKMLGKFGENETNVAQRFLFLKLLFRFEKWRLKHVNGIRILTTHVHRGVHVFTLK